MAVSPLARAISNVFGARRKGERALFDEAYYRTAYADIAAAGVDPYAHFMDHGWREGRNPSADFVTLYYRDAHLEGAEINPLAHYVAAGSKASGLAVAPASPGQFLVVQRSVVVERFDTAFYKLQAGATSSDPIAHYLDIGWKDGRSPNPAFDVTRYLGENAFVAALGVSPFYHWASQTRMRELGAKGPAAALGSVSREQIRAIVAPEFDPAYYLRRQADVRLAGLDPLEHYLGHGWRERRNPTALFDATYYLARNRDAAATRLDPFYHYLTIGRAEGRRPNAIGSRPYPPLRAPTAGEWTRAVPAADTAAAAIVVVMPVYRGFDETLAAIHAVLIAPQRVAFALQVIDDCSPDAKLSAMLADLAARGLFALDVNPQNLGFVKTCNKGLRAFADKEVVLLNADAVVSGDWLDRMQAHARRDPTIATITPLSNNATICSYPVTNDNNLVEPEVTAREMDALAAAANAGRVSEVATGVGFCFWMSRASRAAIGLFDEAAFGRGYGEENDYCLRAAKAGYRNVLAEDIFAYHAGEVSFAELAAGEYAPGQIALLAKHPDYPSRVRQHLRADPGLRGRMRLDLMRLARHVGPRSMVFVSHALAGGIVTHIEHMEARLRAEGIGVVHLRVGVKDRWSVEVACDASDAPSCPNLRPTSFRQIAPLLAEFLLWLSPMAIHLHSLVGFDWAATTDLLDFVRDSRLPYYFTLHDYSVVCHRNDLVLTDGRYCGLPDVAVCRSCVATDRSYPEATDPAERRARYDAFLRDAAAVFAPSSDIAARLARAGADYPITIRPHEEVEHDLPVVASPANSTPFDIVTIGAIGAHKGSRIILDGARDAEARGLPLHFHIIGFSDLTEEMKGVGVTESGRYRDDEEAAALVAALRPACVLLPSIWPETFCFALSLAFRLGVPPAVFDIGAQAERVRAAGYGFVLPYALIDDPKRLNDELCARLARGNVGTPTVAPIAYRDILHDYYGLAR